MKKIPPIYLPISTKNYARKSRGRFTHSLMNTIAKIVKECLSTSFSWRITEIKIIITFLRNFSGKLTALGVHQLTPSSFLSNDRLTLEMNSHFES